ncbi:MAG: OmpH family outer membrane protein [Bacteroidales bacterium]|nr:OmpH family outer membrane protein [Bacteroidales bacterium]
MKNLNPILTIVLAVGLILMYILHFTSTGKGESKSDVKAGKVHVSDSLFPSAPVAFINTDTLVEGYEYAQVLKEKIKTKTTELTGSLQHKYKKLEKEFKAFQDKVSRNGFLSEATFEAAQKELQEKQLELQKIEMEMNNEIQEMQIDMQFELLDTLNQCIKAFNYDNRYKLVLNKTNLTNLVLYGDPGVEITDTIINLLNVRYRKSVE